MEFDAELVDRDGQTRIALSLDGLIYMDRQAAVRIKQLHTKLHVLGGRLCLCHVSPELRDLLDAYQPGHTFALYENEAAPLESFAD